MHTLSKTPFSAGLILLGLVLSAGLSARAQSNEAAAYNDFLIAEQQKIGRVIRDFSGSLTFSPVDEEATRGAYTQMLVGIQSAIESAESLSLLSGDQGLQQAALSLFRFYQSVAENEYQEMMDIYLAGEWDQRTFDRLRSLVETVALDETAFDKAFSDAQARFASHYQIQLNADNRR